jgi:hypothetical protein
MCPDEALQESLSKADRHHWGRLHPTHMGGEYLPSLESDQIEIARIELKSTTADVISVRARKDGAAICYSVVDEYDAEFRVAPQRTLKPLTLWQVIRLIEWNRAFGDDFAHVFSPFYPDLSLHYAQLTRRLCGKRNESSPNDSETGITVINDTDQ